MVMSWSVRTARTLGVGLLECGLEACLGIKGSWVCCHGYLRGDSGRDLFKVTKGSDILHPPKLREVKSLRSSFLPTTNTSSTEFQFQIPFHSSHQSFLSLFQLPRYPQATTHPTTSTVLQKSHAQTLEPPHPPKRCHLQQTSAPSSPPNAPTSASPRNLTRASKPATEDILRLHAHGRKTRRAGFE